MTPNQLKALLVEEADEFLERGTKVDVQRDDSDLSSLVATIHSPSDEAVFRHLYEILRDPAFIDRLNDGMA